jgi:hypothetical protein
MEDAKKRRKLKAAAAASSAAAAKETLKRKLKTLKNQLQKESCSR